MSEIPLEYFLAKPPFERADALPDGAQGVGVFAAVLLFVIGATAIGAEWSSRSIVALLFWEPRRIRVMAAKLAVTALVAAVFALLAQAAWLGAAMLLSSSRGTTGPLPPDFWSRTLGMQGRLVLLGVFVCLMGFGIANLTRNTGAALGVGFVYFAIVENAVTRTAPRLGPVAVHREPRRPRVTRRAQDLPLLRDHLATRPDHFGGAGHRAQQRPWRPDAVALHRDSRRRRHRAVPPSRPDVAAAPRLPEGPRMTSPPFAYPPPRYHGERAAFFLEHDNVWL
jgi:hypothetical protein